MRTKLFFLTLILINSLVYANDYYVGNKDYNEVIYFFDNNAIYFINECSYSVPLLYEKDKSNPNTLILISPKSYENEDAKIIYFTLKNKNSIILSKAGCNLDDRLFIKQNPIFLRSKVSNLRIRELPSTKAKILGLLNKGDKILYIGTLSGESITDHNNLWCVVVTESNKLGFIAKQFLE